MDDPSLPLHWRFAAGQAFARLRKLVHSFDFVRLADGHTYVDIQPDYLVQVIDGFLAEPPGVVWGGDRATLEQLRKRLVEQIGPAHEAGLAAGRRLWQAGERVYGSLTIEALHQLALQSAPADETLRGWFAEGFCYAYSSSEMESQWKEARM